MANAKLNNEYLKQYTQSTGSQQPAYSFLYAGNMSNSVDKASSPLQEVKNTPQHSSQSQELKNRVSPNSGGNLSHLQSRITHSSPLPVQQQSAQHTAAKYSVRQQTPPAVAHHPNFAKSEVMHPVMAYSLDKVVSLQNSPTETMSIFHRLASANEDIWVQLGKLAELMKKEDKAILHYETALRHNPYSVPALVAYVFLLKTKEQFPKAIELIQSILNVDSSIAEVWSALGHCYLMLDELQKAYSAYQQALYLSRDPKEPGLWYGIGVLYDRYGSLDNAEKAFNQLLRFDPNFDKANEVYFRLGIISKEQNKCVEALKCFQYILKDPPKPLSEADIWFQIGQVYEQQKEYELSKEAYERVLVDNPNHAKVLQQLGWLYHQESSSFSNQNTAIRYLTSSLENDLQDAQSWYLLGRCHMALKKYYMAYEAYQQAVYWDSSNPIFWCCIGVLYYQLHQYKDAVDAYSRAIRLNPYISEVWYDLGTLYEACNYPFSDIINAYKQALDLAPNNACIKSKLKLLQAEVKNGGKGAGSVSHNKVMGKAATQMTSCSINNKSSPQKEAALTEITRPASLLQNNQNLDLIQSEKTARKNPSPNGPGGWIGTELLKRPGDELVSGSNTHKLVRLSNGISDLRINDLALKSLNSLNNTRQTEDPKNMAMKNALTTGKINPSISSGIQQLLLVSQECAGTNLTNEIERQVADKEVRQEKMEKYSRINYAAIPSKATQNALKESNGDKNDIVSPPQSPKSLIDNDFQKLKNGEISSHIKFNYIESSVHT